MKLFITLTILIHFLNGIKNESNKKNILKLTDSNFNQTVESFQLILVEFCKFNYKKYHK
jgi:hypothetical protein